MPRPSKHMPREPDGSTKRIRLKRRLTQLRRKRAIIDREIKKLEKLWGSVRPFHKCQRCGYEWRGLNPENVPRNCARCHSAGWNSPVKVTARARKPGDPANPNWGQPHRPPRANKRLEEEPKLSDYHGPRPITLIEPENPYPLEAIGEASQRATEEMLRRAFDLPAGLPPPPGLNDMVPIMERTEYPPLITQAPAAPILYRPRPQEPEPQPESTAMPVPPVVESAPTADDLEIMFPPVAIDARIAAEAGEEGWEDHVETDA